jgi:hypothetical protein
MGSVLRVDKHDLFLAQRHVCCCCCCKLMACTLLQLLLHDLALLWLKTRLYCTILSIIRVAAGQAAPWLLC